MKEVKSQYNDWPYPEPIHDLKEKISSKILIRLFCFCEA